MKLKDVKQKTKCIEKINTQTGCFEHIKSKNDKPSLKKKKEDAK